MGLVLYVVLVVKYNLKKLINFMIIIIYLCGIGVVIVVFIFVVFLLILSNNK